MVKRLPSQQGGTCPLSEIRVTTISDTAGTGPVTLTKQHAAKAWVNFNGTGTIAIRTSFNVSGLTDSGTGDYLYAVTNAFSDESAFVSNGGNAGRPGNSTGNTSSIRVYCSNIANDAAQDTTIVTSQAHGDLA